MRHETVTCDDIFFCCRGPCEEHEHGVGAGANTTLLSDTLLFILNYESGHCPTVVSFLFLLPFFFSRTLKDQRETEVPKLQFTGCEGGGNIGGGGGGSEYRVKRGTGNGQE